MDADWKEVTQAEFFANVGPDTRDVMPSTERPDVTLWKTRNGQIVARSYPGWRNPCDPRRYELLASDSR